MEKQLYREDDEIQREDALAQRGYHLLSDGGLLSQDLLQQFLPIFDACDEGWEAAVQSGLATGRKLHGGCVC